MRVAEFTAYLVSLRLKSPFEHASHSRHTSDNVLVRCLLEDGTEGWGEGVPRSYVTGESPPGVFSQLAATDLAGQFAADCTNWNDVIRMCSAYQPAVLENDPRGCRANAHRCAVELGVLDAFGRLFGEPVSAVTRAFDVAGPIAEARETVQYSGAVSVASRRKEAVRAVQLRVYGFSHCKVKVGISAAADQDRLRRVRRWLGKRCDIRVDANEAWHPSRVVEEIEPLLSQGISCLEQPVAHQYVVSLEEIRRKIPVPVMLDESLASMADAEAAVRMRTCDLFNIRLSKCGGFLNSLRLATLADSAGLGYQLGCHPGESGILSAAGRHFATSVRGIRYLEGSYDRHLLKELLTNEDLTFGYGGRASAIHRPGLGVTVNRPVLDRLTLRKQAFPLR